MWFGSFGVADFDASDAGAAGVSGVMDTWAVPAGEAGAGAAAGAGAGAGGGAAADFARSRKPDASVFRSAALGSSAAAMSSTRAMTRSNSSDAADMSFLSKSAFAFAYI